MQKCVSGYLGWQASLTAHVLSAARTTLRGVYAVPDLPPKTTNLAACVTERKGSFSTFASQSPPQKRVRISPIYSPSFCVPIVSHTIYWTSLIIRSSPRSVHHTASSPFHYSTDLVFKIRYANTDSLPTVQDPPFTRV